MPLPFADPTIFPITRNPIRNGDPASWPAWWTKLFRYAQQRIDQADDDFLDWQTPTLGGGWVAYNTSIYAAPGYMRQRGRCYLRGLMKSGATGVDLFTLDQSCWPADRDHIFRTFAVNTTPTPDDPGIARINVRTSGTVQVNSYGYGGTNGYVSLAGISWSVGP